MSMGGTGSSPLVRVGTAGLACRGCAYELDGLSLDGQCPECGMPIERSIRGDALQYASPQYVRTLWLGASIALLTVVLEAIGLVGFIVFMALTDGGKNVASGRATELVIDLASFASGLLGLIGWWLLTMPDPAHRGPAQDTRARRWLRAVLTVMAVASLIQFVVAMTPALHSTPLHMLSGELNFNSSTQWTPLFTSVVAARVLLWLVQGLQFFLQLAYVRSIGQRLPSRWLTIHTKRAMWLVPLGWTVGWAACGLGPPAAMFYMFWIKLHTWRGLRLVMKGDIAGLEKLGAVKVKQKQGVAPLAPPTA